MSVRLVLCALLAMAACAPEAEQTVGAVKQAEALPLDLAYQGLCQAGQMAESGDIWNAANVFNTRSHAYLHEVADQLQAKDRAAAASFLEAKQAVEAQLATPDSANPQAVASSLAALESALGDAAVSLGFARPACK